MTAAAPPRPPGRLDTARYDGPSNLEGQLRLAEALAGARSTIPPIYRGSAADVLSVMLLAASLDIPLATALHNVQWDAELGKGAMSAQLMGALLQRGGVFWQMTEDPGKSVTLTFTRSDGRPGGTCMWTIGEALRAGIANRSHWRQFPSDMLFARCLARGARRFAPDLVLGFGYTPDELADMRRTDSGETTEYPAASPEVLDFLSELGDDPTAEQIRAHITTASKRGGLGEEQAGGGQSVAQVLHDMWLAASAREAAAAADAAIASAELLPDETGAAPADDAPAGEGTFECGCATAEVFRSGGVHREGCHVGADS